MIRLNTYIYLQDIIRKTSEGLTIEYGELKFSKPLYILIFVRSIIKYILRAYICQIEVIKTATKFYEI